MSEMVPVGPTTSVSRLATEATLMRRDLGTLHVRGLGSGCRRPSRSWASALVDDPMLLGFLSKHVTECSSAVTLAEAQDFCREGASLTEDQSKVDPRTSFAFGSALAADVAPALRFATLHAVPESLVRLTVRCAHTSKGQRMLAVVAGDVVRTLYGEFAYPGPPHCSLSLICDICSKEWTIDNRLLRKAVDNGPRSITVEKISRRSRGLGRP